MNANQEQASQAQQQPSRKASESSTSQANKSAKVSKPSSPVKRPASANNFKGKAKQRETYYSKLNVSYHLLSKEYPLDENTRQCE